MTPSVLIALSALAVTALSQIAGLLIWGAALSQRVRALEREVEPFRNLDVRVARIEARLESLVEQLKDLNASIRWMGRAGELAGQGLAPA